MGWLLLSVGCVNGIGIAVGFTALTVLTVQPVPEAHHGLLSSVATTAYFFGGGLGLSLLSLFIESGSTIGVGPVAVLQLCALVGLGWLFIDLYRTGKSAKTRRSVA